MPSLPRAAQRPAFVLALFVCAHSLLSIDRGVMAILAEPIKRDFHLSDSQLGLLTGLGFSLFFGIGGIPIGMLVDRMSRRRILAASVFVFSALTALSSFTTSFVEILLTRSLVGAGEAGGGPSMASMLADLYPPERRASAMAVFYIGTPLGSILAFLIGGTVAGHYGWRTTFLVAGVPGILLSGLLLLLIREPARLVDAGIAGPARQPGFGQTIRFILGQRALRHILLTPILTSAATAGIFNFAASYFIRSHGLSLPQVGVLLAGFYGVVGVIGSVVGGRIVDALARRDERWRPWYCAIANFAAMLAVPLMTLSPGFPLAVTGLAIVAFFTTSTYGPLLAMLQSLVGSRMRGTLTAIFYLLSYLLGAASGPQIVGAMSDVLHPLHGEQSLRYAMALTSLLYAWGALHFVLGARRFRQDLIVAARL